MTFDITFRYEPVPADARDVRAIVAGSGFFNPAEIEIAVELVDDRLASGERSSYRFVFAERDRAVTGYTCYGAIDGTAGSYDLYWIAVDPDGRGGGLGRRLMHETERLIRAAGGLRIYAETSGRDQYELTRRFYERLGFARETQLRDFYAPGDDKVFYVKAL
jgi:ribosomal protein S18 acetylase RimI-like enzyme